MCSGGFQGTEVQLSTKANRCTEVKHRYFCHHYTKPMLCAVKFQRIMFKIGQKVVCINAEAGWLDGVKELVEGEIYTVNHIIEQINNVGVNGVSGCWNASRFRPLNDGWVEEILCKLIEEVEADELVSA